MATRCAVLERQTVIPSNKEKYEYEDGSTNRNNGSGALDPLALKQHIATFENI